MRIIISEMGQFGPLVTTLLAKAYGKEKHPINVIRHLYKITITFLTALALNIRREYSQALTEL